MSETPNDPPMVLRPEQPIADARPLTPQKPRPGFWEALLWALIFLAAEMLGLIVTAIVVFLIFAFSTPEPDKFLNAQLDSLKQSTQPSPNEEKPPLPAELGQSLAWGMLAAAGFALVLILIVLPRRIGPDWKRQIGVRRPHWLHVVLVLLIVPGFVVVPDLIQGIFQWATGLKPPSTTVALKGIFSQFPWPLTALAVAIGPGVVEEFWCRAFLGRGLCARYGVVVGVLLTSLFFALMHMDRAQLIVFVCMGAYLHFVYFATRSIWASILLHASNNGIAILLALTLPPEKLEGAPTPLIVPLVACALVLFGSIALWTGRAVIEPVEGNDPNWKPEYPGISLPPPDANAKVAHESISPVALIFTVISFCAMLYVGYRFLI